jgi:hypothetical protein
MILGGYVHGGGGCRPRACSARPRLRDQRLVSGSSLILTSPSHCLSWDFSLAIDLNSHANMKGRSSGHPLLSRSSTYPFRLYPSGDALHEWTSFQRVSLRGFQLRREAVVVLLHSQRDRALGDVKVATRPRDAIWQPLIGKLLPQMTEGGDFHVRDSRGRGDTGHCILLPA